MKEIGFVKFITGEMWKPNNDIYGILPMIVGSIYVTAGAIIVGVPIGILTSVFMAMYCPKKIYRPLKAATEPVSYTHLIRMRELYIWMHLCVWNVSLTTPETLQKKYLQ